MTVSSTNNKNRYEGNGVTTAFAFTGRIYSASDIAVDIITRATDAFVETLTLTTHYTVTITGPEAATVTITAPAKIPSVTQDLLIRRSLAQTQTVDLPTGTRFPAVSVENALDKVTTLVQDLSENLERVVQLPITSSDTVPGIGSLTTDEVVVYDGTNFITDGVTTADITTAAATATTQAGIATTQAGLAATAKTAAETAETNAETAAALAESWAIDPIGDRPEGSAKYWAGQASAIVNLVGIVDIAGTASTPGGVSFGEDTDNGTNTVTIIAPASIASNRTLTLPDASGTVALTNGLTGQTFTGAQRASQTALTSTSNSIAVDFALNNDFTHTMTEDTTLENPTNIVVGQSGAIHFTQHASSPKTLAYGSYWKSAGGVDFTITASNGAKDTIYYHVRSTTEIEYAMVQAIS